MKTGMSGLSGDSLLASIRDHFRTIKDHRDTSRIRIELSDFLMSGFAIFSLKFPSLLKFEQQMREQKYASRLAPIYQLNEVPSDTHLRSVLDEIDPESLAPVFKRLFNKAQKSKHLERFRFLEDKYLLCIDGSQYFSSDTVCCDLCMSKKIKSEDQERILYYHQMLAASIVHPEQDCVIPLCPEPLKKQDGADKNDCEQVALRRFLDRLRRDHPKLKLILTADALHATGPLIRDLRLFNTDFILAVKPGSHEKLFEGIEKWDQRGLVKHVSFEEEIGDKIKKKRVHRFRYANKILFNFSDVNTSVHFLEYWETTQWLSPKGELKEEKRHFSWVTDFEINSENVMPLMRGGRARWKIENETFNTLKNHGYEFEHNFGHGEKHLSTVFAYLMFLAFLFDQLQQIGCKLFQKLLKKSIRKSYMWEDIRNFFKLSYKFDAMFASWTDFLERAIGPPENTS
ncbi:MAG: transposase [Bdellovibrionia bacterium]